MSIRFEFTSLADFAASLTTLPGPDTDAIVAARARNEVLTKPPGALGRLEGLAIWYAGWRADPRPKIAHPQALVFAGNHGVAALGVSAFPAEVTAQMVGNFAAGGAAINQLCKAYGAKLSVHALTLDTPTEDFTARPAMDEAACLDALRTGWEAVDPEADILILGEMGIGNTTSAAALAAALHGGRVDDWVGRGTGVDDAGLARKCDVVAQGVARHGHLPPLDMLAALGGRELAAIAGAVIAARRARIPVLLDGFICTAAAAVLACAAPGSLDHCQAGHVSAEAGHARLLGKLGLDPILSLGLRLGEGSGAALALGILQGALACHSDMASFTDAGVSTS